MYSISIPKRCHAGWDNMLPVEKGRYCSACAKTVIDFSILSDDEVQAYFVKHFSEQICGHFRASQLKRIIIQLPANSIGFNQPFWKRFLVLCLLIFGTSVFPFETVVAGIQTEHTQQAIQSSQPEKKQKKPRIARRLKIKKRFMRPISPNMIMIMGYTQTIDQQCVNIPGTPRAKLADSNKRLSYQSGTIAAPLQKSGKGEPVSKPPFVAVYVLPKSLAVKKQLLKTT